VGLSEFSTLYDEHESSNSRNTEIDATISLLTELQKWSRAVGNVEAALEQNDLGSIRESFSTASSLLSSLEKRTNMVGIIPKMKARKDQLAASIVDGFVSQWHRMISIDSVKTETVLTVTDNATGKTFPSCG